MEESWHPDTARAPGSKKQNLQEIKDYLDTHYTEKITLDALAERFYINKFYLTRVFRSSSVNRSPTILCSCVLPNPSGCCALPTAASRLWPRSAD